MNALIIEDEPKYYKKFEVGLVNTKIFDEIKIADIKLLVENKFEDFYNLYKMFDFFLIDVNLTNKVSCNIGLEYFNYLVNINPDIKYLIISEYDLFKRSANELVNHNWFLDKRDFDLNYTLEIAIELKTKEICN